MSICTYVAALTIVLAPAGRALAAGDVAKDVARYENFFRRSAHALTSGGTAPHTHFKTYGLGAYLGIGGRGSLGKATVFHNGMTQTSMVLDLTRTAGLELGAAIELNEMFVLGRPGTARDEVLPKMFRDSSMSMLGPFITIAEGKTKRGSATQLWSKTLGPGLVAGASTGWHRIITVGRPGRWKKSKLLERVEAGHALAEQAATALEAGNEDRAKDLVGEMDRLHQKIDQDRRWLEQARRALRWGVTAP
jgi:hypothetical protein